MYIFFPWHLSRKLKWTGFQAVIKIIDNHVGGREGKNHFVFLDGHFKRNNKYQLSWLQLDGANIRISIFHVQDPMNRENSKYLKGRRIWLKRLIVLLVPTMEKTQWKLVFLTPNQGGGFYLTYMEIDALVLEQVLVWTA